jgi:hypothetical protein
MAVKSTTVRRAVKILKSGFCFSIYDSNAMTTPGLVNNMTMSLFIKQCMRRSSSDKSLRLCNLDQGLSLLIVVGLPLSASRRL